MNLHISEIDILFTLFFEKSKVQKTHFCLHCGYSPSGIHFFLKNGISKNDSFVYIVVIFHMEIT